MSEAQVVVLGDANVDMVLRPPDQSNRNPAPELHGGGTAANVATGLSRLEIPVAFVGGIGNDNFGRWVQADLTNEKVDVQGLKFFENEFTVIVVAVIDNVGERLIYVWPPNGGPHLSLDQQDIDLARWPQARWLHTTGVCLRGNPTAETIVTSMQQAKSLGWTTSLDLNLRLESWGMDDVTRQIFERAIAQADVIFGNAHEEIVPLTGKASTEEAAQNLCDHQRIVVARQGDQGALICTPDELFRSPAHDIQVVDTLGAGDAFDAGFIAARLFGKDLHEAATWGNLVAALKIEQPGARGLPTQAEFQKRKSA